MSSFFKRIIRAFRPKKNEHINHNASSIENLLEKTPLEKPLIGEEDLRLEDIDEGYWDDIEQFGRGYKVRDNTGSEIKKHTTKETRESGLKAPKQSYWDDFEENNREDNRRKQKQSSSTDKCKKKSTLLGQGATCDKTCYVEEEHQCVRGRGRLQCRRYEYHGLGCSTSGFEMTCTVWTWNMRDGNELKGNCRIRKGFDKDEVKGPHNKQTRCGEGKSEFLKRAEYFTQRTQNGDNAQVEYRKAEIELELRKQVEVEVNRAVAKYARGLQQMEDRMRKTRPTRNAEHGEEEIWGFEDDKKEDGGSSSDREN